MAKKLKLKNIFGKDAKIKFEGSGDGVTKVAELPSEGVTGRIYYNTTDKKYYVYDETTSDFTELGGNINPTDIMPTVEQTTTSEESGGTNVVTFTFPNGETTEVSIKNGTQGAQGNSGVASADGVIVVNNLTEGGTTVTENGVTKVKVLSAEMGKELANSTIVEKGSLGQALTKAMGNNAYFPWLLVENTNDGTITKMIWHTGNRAFVDALGGFVTSDQSGVLTVIATKAGAMRVANRSSDTKDLRLNAGLNQFTLDELKVNASDVAGELGWITFKDATFENDVMTVGSTNINIPSYIDFGGVELTSLWHMFVNGTTLVGVDRVKYKGTGSSMARAFESQNTLKFITFSDCTVTSAYTDSQPLIASKLIKSLDLSKVHAPWIGLRDMSSLQYLDIRNINPKSGSMTSIPSNQLAYCPKLSVIVIGDFDTSTITTAPSGLLSGANADTTAKDYTLVCVNQTPPATNANGYVLNTLLNKALEILVPPGTSEAYAAADCWSTYSAKITEYAEGTY